MRYIFTINKLVFLLLTKIHSHYRIDNIYFVQLQKFKKIFRTNPYWRFYHEY